MAKSKDKKPKTVLAKVEEVARKLGVEVDPLSLEAPVVGFYSTGIPPLDAELGGGVAVGGVYEFFGPEKAGKSAAADLFIASCHRAGDGEALIEEYENTREVARMKRCGIDLKRVLMLKPDNTEQGWVTLNALINGKRAVVQSAIKRGQRVSPSIVVWDSLGQSASKKEVDAANKGGVKGAKAEVGGNAKLFALNLRTTTHAWRRYGITLVIVNQETEKIGENSHGFGPPPTTTPGGKAPKRKADVRIKFSSVWSPPFLKGKGLLVTLRFRKNKFNPKAGQAHFVIDYDRGPSAGATALYLLHEANKLKNAPKKGRFRLPFWKQFRRSSFIDRMETDAAFAAKVWTYLAAAKVKSKEKLVESDE